MGHRGAPGSTGIPGAAKTQPKEKKRTGLPYGRPRRWTLIEKDPPTSLGNLVANLVDSTALYTNMLNPKTYSRN